MTLEQELALVERSKENVHAFGELYDFYIDRIYNYIYSRTLNKELAEDITSKVFLKAVEQISKFDTSRGVKFGSWLYRTAHNLIIDELKRKSNKFQSVEEEPAHNGENNIDREVRITTIQKQIAFTLKSINKKYQLIISLRFFSELEIDEISDVLETKRSNVSVLLHRALKDFKKEYTKKFGESEIF